MNREVPNAEVAPQASTSKDPVVSEKARKTLSKVPEYAGRELVRYHALINPDGIPNATKEQLLEVLLGTSDSTTSTAATAPDNPSVTEGDQPEPPENDQESSETSLENDEDWNEEQCWQTIRQMTLVTLRSKLLSLGDKP